MLKMKMPEWQRQAMCRAQRTLDGIIDEIFWGKVIARVTPKVDGNGRARFNSHASAVRSGRRY